MGCPPSSRYARLGRAPTGDLQGFILRREVDLGILTTGNLVYAKEAVTRGRRIFDRDHTVTARFEMYALSMYASLQEARREVLRAYAA